MQQEITIQLQYVLNKLHEFTAYEGAKLIVQDETAYKRIATTEVDETFLKSCINEAIADLSSMLATYQPYVTNSDTGISIKLTLPSNFDTSQIAGLTDIATMYFYSYALFKWFSIINKQDAELQMQTATKNLLSMRKLCTMRASPTRKHPTEVMYKKTNYE